MKVIYEDRQLSLQEVELLPASTHSETSEETTMPETTLPDEPSIKITRLRIKMFRGIENLDVAVPPGGLIFSGENAIGKSSALFAIQAVLKGEGVGPEAIRFDAKESLMLIDLAKADQALVVKRSITRSKTTAELQNGDGTPIPRAKEQLRALLGEQSLDPLKLYLADAKEQRRLILSACPIEVTADDLNRWCETTQEWSTAGHGHEVLGRVRQMYYDRRTTVGQTFDKAKAEADVKASTALTAECAIKAALNGLPADNLTPEAVRTHVSAAERELAVLRDRRKQAEERDTASDGTRAKIAELRARASELMAQPEAEPPSAAELELAAAELHQAGAAVEAAKRRMTEAAAAYSALDNRKIAADRLANDAGALADQANELEQVIASTADVSPAVIAEQIAAAEIDLETAQVKVSLAEMVQKSRQARQDADAATASVAIANAEWERLNRIVKRLTDEAPAELAKRANTIPGLGITADAITLDGKEIHMLSGAERMRFCVALVKRMVTKAKILVVDGLEQLAPKKLPEFVREVLSGGWQLFATRVADGELDIVDCYRIAGG